MAAISLKTAALILSCLALTTACAHPETARTSKPHEPIPHWAAFHTPRYDEVARAIITVPPGYRLCSSADSFSSVLWFYVPIDRELRCEQLPKSADPEQMPDFILIGHSPDVPFKYNTTDDYVKDEPFYCHGLSYGYKDRHPVSNALTSIESAGKVLAGLDTIACTRQNDAGDRYSRAFLAYRPKPNDNDIGHGYEIAAYVHMKNKHLADRLLEEIVKSFKLLN